ncbi:hypothetical protein T11_3332, partial [Trichinella zimbabwensis]
LNVDAVLSSAPHADDCILTVTSYIKWRRKILSSNGQRRN